MSSSLKVRVLTRALFSREYLWLWTKTPLSSDLVYEVFKFLIPRSPGDGIRSLMLNYSRKASPTRMLYHHVFYVHKKIPDEHPLLVKYRLNVYGPEMMKNLIMATNREDYDSFPGQICYIRYWNIEKSESGEDESVFRGICICGTWLDGVNILRYDIHYEAIRKRFICPPENQ